jgi:hypothetical protein
MTEAIPQPALRMNRQHTYHREHDREGFAGCIYCNETPETPLTKEHIIPESLGGALILENASCDECAGETHAFEGHAANLLRPVRRQLRVGGKRGGKKGRESREAERFVLKLDNHKVKVPVDEFPALLMSLVFPTPGILVNEQPEDKLLSGGIYSVELMPEFGERLNKIKTKYRANAIGIVGIETKGREKADDFGRMLSKIAHSYVVAELGSGNFEPFLVPAIRGMKPYYFPYYIGSAIGKEPPFTDLHRIEIDESGLGMGKFILVKLRLFADRDTPTHYIVVGRPLSHRG